MSWGKVFLYFIWINKILSKCQIVDFSKPNAHECWALFLDLFAFYYPEFYHFTKCNFEISSYLIKPGLFCIFFFKTCDFLLWYILYTIIHHSSKLFVVWSPCWSRISVNSTMLFKHHKIMFWLEVDSGSFLCYWVPTVSGSSHGTRFTGSVNGSMQWNFVSFMVKEYPTDYYCTFAFPSLDEDILIVFTLELLWIWQLWISFLYVWNFSTLEYKLMNRI